MSQRPFITRRVAEYGWATFDRRTGEKLIGDDLGPWWSSRKAATAAGDRTLEPEEQEQ